jgi:hypothetical protein
MAVRTARVVSFEYDEVENLVGRRKAMASAFALYPE